MANIYRTHNCGELRISDAGKEVRLAGFVQTIRNLGKMVFLDLRDENGITQIVVSDDIDLTDVTKECTLTVTGDVVERASKNDRRQRCGRVHREQIICALPGYSARL